MSTLLTLLRAVVDEPEDEVRRFVLADWLEEDGAAPAVVNNVRAAKIQPRGISWEYRGTVYLAGWRTHAEQPEEIRLRARDAMIADIVSMAGAEFCMSCGAHGCERCEEIGLTWRRDDDRKGKVK